MVPSQPAVHASRRGATAAEAVDLSDDDDDVVIIEEGMQPEPHPPQPPQGLKAPAEAKQQGGSEGLDGHYALCLMHYSMILKCLTYNQNIQCSYPQ